MKPTFDACLRDLTARLDDAQEQRNRDAWQAFVAGQCTEEVFVPPARRPAPPRVEWPTIHTNDAQADYELMMWQQFKYVSDLLAEGVGMRPCVRCNYGTGILPTVLGCELFAMPRETDTLPTALPMGADRARLLVAAGVPDIRAGLGASVFDCADRFAEVFRAYPGLARHVDFYHPDLQGPVDVAEVVWGSELFLAFCDEPDLVQRFLALITATYAAFMREWFRRVPPVDGTATHWGFRHGGQLMLRNDSLMNMSGAMYTEFVQPQDERLFAAFGGGAIHFCGRADHYIAALSRTRGLAAIHLSQPHLNDMENIYRHTVDRGIKLLGLLWPTVAAARAAGRPLRGLVQSLPPTPAPG